MRDVDVIDLVECLGGDLPVAVEDHPATPAHAHVLQLERIQHAGRRLQILSQRYTIRIHVDPDPAAPGIDLDLAEPRVVIVQRATPIVLLPSPLAVPVAVDRPAMEGPTDRGRLAHP